MNRHFKFMALAIMGLAFVSCSDEDLVSDGIPVSGDDISFGASATVDEGILTGESKGSRTSYGDVKDNKICVNWCVGDEIAVGCKQAVGAKMAIYRVRGTSSSNTNDNSHVDELDRVSEGTGMQWGQGQHTFYAAYPSPNKVGQDLMNLDYNTGVVKGFMPSTYDAEPVVQTDGNIVVTPDMTFGYMVAQQQYANPVKSVALHFTPIVTALEFDIVGGGFENIQDPGIKVSGLTLTSKSQSVVGNFEYNFGDNQIVNKSDFTSGTNSVHLKFTKGAHLQKDKHLKATFFIVPTENVSSETPEILHDDLVLTIWYEGDNGVLTAKNAIVGVDLQARKLYSFRNMKMPAVQIKETSNWFGALDDDIYISQLSFPVAGHVVSSQYAGQAADTEEAKPLDMKLKKEQIHPFKHLWNIGIRGFEMKTSFTEKVLPGTEGQDLGIAGGSVSPNDGTVSAYEFAMSPFVCSAHELLGAKKFTLGGAFEDGYEQLKNNPTETIVYLMTYQSYGGDNDYGYRPDLYLQGLQNYLTEFCTNHGISDPSSVFVKLGTGSTVKDLRGKIAIVVRLYDNAYVDTRGANIVKENLYPNANWAPYISVINNWGTCIDNWDIRYGYNYAREGAFKREGREELETKMWYGASSDMNSYVKINDKTEHAAEIFPKNVLGEHSYKFNVNQPYLNVDDGVSGNREATVQCWERVIPETKKYYTRIWDRYGLLGTHYAYLFFEWQESLTEKVQAIRWVVDKAMETRGKTAAGLFVNSLAGYFPVEASDMSGSAVPYSTSQAVYHWQFGWLDRINLSFNQTNEDGMRIEQVTGGDYASCAGMLNAFMHGYLTKKRPEEMGPLGLVVMDYIDADEDDFAGVQVRHGNSVELKSSYAIGDYKINVPKSDGGYVTTISAAQAAQASKHLPKLIIENNFRFPLLKKGISDAQTSADVTTEAYSQQRKGGNHISFE